ILQPIELLNRDFGTGPFHLCQIMFARIAGDVEPDGEAAVDVQDADSRRGVLFAGLRIANGNQLRVRTLGAAGDEKLLDAFAVQLPKGDRAAVGAPAVAVAEEEFLFVNPVEGAVDDGVGAVARQLTDAAIDEILNIDV